MAHDRRYWAICFFCVTTSLTIAQVTPDNPSPGKYARAENLGLPVAQTTRLKDALVRKDYAQAEGLLLDSLSDPLSSSTRTSALLAFLGGIYFLAGDYRQAAASWTRSDAIAPLQSDVRFSLAMAYVHMNQPQMAETQIAALRTIDGTNPIYPYWLGRLKYDAQAYDRAIAYFEEALRLDASMAKAYDNLGLCYFYLDKNNLAIAEFLKAIELEDKTPHPSPWPYLNLGIAYSFVNRPSDAEKALKHAIILDPSLSPAHFQLGNLFEQEGRLKDAVEEHRLATQLDPAYSQPHFALARLYRKLGNKPASEEELKVFFRLKPSSSTSHLLP